MPHIPKARLTRGRVALALGLAGAMGLSAVTGVVASSHREAPLIANDPAADNTDVYAFVSPDRPDSVTLIANWLPAQDPAAGPNYFNFADDVLYAIHVDNNGDAVADVSYEWRYRTQIQDPNTYLYAKGAITSLTDPDYNYRQVQDLYVVKNGVRTTLLEGRVVPPSNVGPVSTPNYAALASQGVYDFTTPSGTGRNFSGQRDDAFFADIGSIFDLGQLRPFLPAYGPSTRAAEAGRDFFAGQNIHTTSIQVPIAEIVQNASQPIVGIWSTASRPKVRVYDQNSGADPVNRGRFVQVSRLGAPLVNEVVIPLGLKDTFNTLEPANDAAALSTPADAQGVTIPLVQRPELAGIIEAIYPSVDTPPAPRNDLVQVFLTGIPGLNAITGAKPAELLRLNTSIKPDGSEDRLGAIAGDTQGFPNGRRLGDDVTDSALRVVAGVLVPEFNRSPNNALGDGVDTNDTGFLPTFPYQATPWQGYGENNETRVAVTG